MLETKLFGQFEVLCNRRRLFIPTRNTQRLFSTFPLNSGQDQGRERLAGLLWPDSLEENLCSNL